MDRLPTVAAGAAARPRPARGALPLLLLLGLLLAGCEDGASAPPSTQRVVSVAREPSEAPDLASFCDVSAGGRTLTLPPLDREAPRREGWRWINVWATWCRPCIEEMPLLVEWQRRLSSAGISLDLVFLSVDEDAESVARFRSAHREVPDSVRLTDASALQPWVASLGLDEGATLPIHVFADPSGRIRCARSGAVNASSYDTVRLLVASP